MALKRMGIVDNYEVNHIYSCKFNLDTRVSKSTCIWNILYIFNKTIPTL